MPISPKYSSVSPENSTPKPISPVSIGSISLRDFLSPVPKKNLVIRRLYSNAVDQSTGLQCDQTISLDGFYTKRDYPEKLRRIHFLDRETGKQFVVLTNNFTQPALTITNLYRCRWQVELFFNWIKQHPRIKSLYGTLENAVKIQLWIAISVFVIGVIVKKRLKIEHSLDSILQILSVALFEKTPILQALSLTEYTSSQKGRHNQLMFFNF
jgi:hypothetical protein